MAAGAAADDIVPFTAYAAAARQLTRPSSLARALAAGATAVERIDLMVLLSPGALGVEADRLQAIVCRVQAALDRNRADS